jgi:hypothetical protein
MKSAASAVPSQVPLIPTLSVVLAYSTSSSAEIECLLAVLPDIQAKALNFMFGKKIADPHPGPVGLLTVRSFKTIL